MNYKGLIMWAKKRPKGRRGAMLVVICVMVFAFVVTVAFSVDVAYMNLINSELRTATDAAAKAASETLARTQDRNAAIARGIEIGAQNRVGNRSLQLTNRDFEFGRSEVDNTGRFVFRRDVSPFNSVRVNGERTEGSSSGSVGLPFGHIFNMRAFEPTETCTATYIQRDIVLVVDRSGSMAWFRKFDDLKSAVALFISILDESPVVERIGLASYATSASIDIELTENTGLINSALARMPVAGSTNISGGMDSGRTIMNRGGSREFVEKTMILLTDGVQNAGRPARSAAVDVVSDGTIIHTITFGTDADRNAMATVASVGRGRYFHAANGTQLREVFREIALTLTSIITE